MMPCPRINYLRKAVLQITIPLQVVVTMVTNQKELLAMLAYLQRLPQRESLQGFTADQYPQSVGRMHPDLYLVEYYRKVHQYHQLIVRLQT
jgi:hypothetical protein